MNPSPARSFLTLSNSLMAAISILRKRLSETDVRFRFAFPTAKLRYLPAFQPGANWVRIPVRVKYGDELRLRELRCAVRRNGSKTPVLGRGWKQIVREKELKAGDWLIFYQLENGDYRIDFERSIRLFGTDVMAGV